MPPHTDCLPVTLLTCTSAVVPPHTGTGKTTLAHVIARHCGFRVVEVNASDARSAPNLTRAVLDAAEMAPVLDSKWACAGGFPALTTSRLHVLAALV